MKMVCVNNGSIQEILDIGRIYEIEDYDHHIYCRVFLENETLMKNKWLGTSKWIDVFKERFITLKEYRKFKLKEIEDKNNENWR